MSPSPLITVAELASRLEDPDLRIIDASWFLPAEGRSGRDEFNRERIPRAVFFDIDAISDTSVDLPHMLPSPAAFADSA